MTPKSLDLPAGPYRFFHSQFAKYVPVPKGISVAGQTAIITGGNAGLGFHSAKTLLEMGLSRLILAVRTPSKGEAAAAKLRETSPKAHIEVWQVDMLSYKSVQEFAAKCETLDRIDFVILNAGALEQEFKLGPHGHEVMFQVNYLSTCLLATLLLPTLKRKAPSGRPGHLTIVNSGTALIPQKFESVKNEKFLPYFDEKSKFGMNSYANTKALAHFWIVKLAERVSPEDVVVNLVDPGLIKGTDIDAAVVRGKESHGSYLMESVLVTTCWYMERKDRR